jgi:GT2 family glycosyltransferase
MEHVANSANVLILNPDLRIAAGSILALVETASLSGTGAAVPMILDENGRVYPSLRREPTLTRALGDALLGSRLDARPSWSSEIVPVGPSYETQHDIEWATGAALLVRAAVAEQVGPWDERFFLYSEEVDYCRRIREHGWHIRFNPEARVVHRQGGSGSSPMLDALQIVNRVRYVEKWHTPAYSRAFRGLTVLATLPRIRKRGRAATLRFLTHRKDWAHLPHATSTPRLPPSAGS